MKHFYKQYYTAYQQAFASLKTHLIFQAAFFEKASQYNTVTGEIIAVTLSATPPRANCIE